MWIHNFNALLQMMFNIHFNSAHGMNDIRLERITSMRNLFHTVESQLHRNYVVQVMQQAML